MAAELVSDPVRGKDAVAERDAGSDMEEVRPEPEGVSLLPVRVRLCMTVIVGSLDAEYDVEVVTVVVPAIEWLFEALEVDDAVDESLPDSLSVYVA